MAVNLHLSDLQGLSRLSIDGVRGVTDLVEDVHHAVLRVPGIRAVSPDGRTGGIPGLVYRSINGITGRVGRGLDVAFNYAGEPTDATHSSPAREQFLAVLNGVLGDHLAASENPLAVKSALRHLGRPIELDRACLTETWPQASSRLLVTAHGLCMHDGHWRLASREAVGKDARGNPSSGKPDPFDTERSGLPDSLAAAHDYSTIDFHYNTGRHVSDSGRDFADLLQRLVTNWPVKVRQLVILGHSMGGLVARSAVDYGLEAGQNWPAHLEKIVSLGTPHHGSPVERAGHGIDRALGISRYSAPFARVGKIRSAGITDLRHGNVTEGDWHAGQRELGRFDYGHDTRGPVRLPAHVELFAVAATLNHAPDSPRSRYFGDGLVPVPSALGQHSNPARSLPVDICNQFIATETGHLGLLRSPKVARQVSAWLA